MRSRFFIQYSHDYLKQLIIKQNCVLQVEFLKIGGLGNDHQGCAAVFETPFVISNYSLSSYLRNESLQSV